MPHAPYRFLLPLVLTACAVSNSPDDDFVTPGDGPDASMAEPDAGPSADGDQDDGEPADGSDGTPMDGSDDGESCVGITARATLERSPVDIIWVVDNSASMQPAIDQVTRGINGFAERIGSSDLDYRVIMLSLRGRGEMEVSGSTRYGVCVPAPLAGDGSCGNGERFFQSSIDIKSTQPLEQLLGTFGQTSGYRAGESRGGEAWAAELRPEATKSIVVVTDDNSRLSAQDFEHFRGGPNPNNGSLSLPAGLLDASHDGLFDGYLFHGLYGWGSESDADVSCLFDDDSEPASSGPTYTELVERTGGVRAQICDGASAWAPFFAEIATAVENTAAVACDFEIPDAPASMTLNPAQVNVSIRLPGAPAIKLGKVARDGCSAEGGWFYDSETAPSHVTLCPESCELAQRGAGTEDGGVDVQFGCDTIVL